MATEAESRTLLELRAGEGLVLRLADGREVRVWVHHLRPASVKFGIEGPRDVPAWRGETPAAKGGVRE